MIAAIRVATAAVLLVGLAAPSGHSLAAPLLEDAKPKAAAGDAMALQWYRSGVEALARGNLDQAKSSFEMATSLGPPTSEPWLGLAEVARRRHDLVTAERCMKQAEKVGPARSDVQVAWFKLRMAQGRTDDALAALQRAVRYDPKAVRPKVDLGDMYLLVLHQPDKAVPLYQAALDLAPRDLDITLALGTAQASAGHIDDATRTLRAAAELAPNNPAPLVTLGTMLGRAHDETGAMAAYAEAAKRPGGILPAGLAKAATQTTLGKPDAARATLAEVLKVEPANRQALVALAVLDAQTGHRSEAEVRLKDAMAKDPALPSILNDVAWQDLQAHRDPERQLLLAQLAVSLAPNVAAFHDTLGWIYRDQHDLQKALEQLQRAATLGGTAEMMTHQAIVLREMGNTDQARRTVDRALALDPGYKPAAELQAALPK